jgi:hypothetical protein
LFALSIMFFNFQIFLFIFLLLGSLCLWWMSCCCCWSYSLCCYKCLLCVVFITFLAFICSSWSSFWGDIDPYKKYNVHQNIFGKFRFFNFQNSCADSIYWEYLVKMFGNAIMTLCCFPIWKPSIRKCYPIWLKIENKHTFYQFKYNVFLQLQVLIYGCPKGHMMSLIGCEFHGRRLHSKTH